MDSLRSKKVNKKPWIIGGGITVLIIILIIVLCVTLGSSAESGTSVGIKNVYEAFAYIDNHISTTYKNEDGVRTPLLNELRMLGEEVRVAEVMYKKKLEAESKGEKYDIKKIENQLLNGRFIEKDGKIEMVIEDDTGDVYIPPEEPKADTPPTKLERSNSMSEDAKKPESATKPQSPNTDSAPASFAHDHVPTMGKTETDTEKQPPAPPTGPDAGPGTSPEARPASPSGNPAPPTGPDAGPETPPGDKPASPEGKPAPPAGDGSQSNCKPEAETKPGVDKESPQDDKKKEHTPTGAPKDPTAGKPETHKPEETKPTDPTVSNQ